MKVLIGMGSFLLAVCGVFASPQSVDFSQMNKPATIKVLLQQEIDRVVVEVRGRHFVYNPLNGQQIGYGTNSKRFVVNCDKTGIQWGAKFPGVYQLRFVPGDSQSSILVNGIQYRGCLEIYHDKPGFHVVNEVDVESYLKSILSMQVQQPLHEEALRAMVIAARTHAYFQSKKDSGSLWHVRSEDVSYQGRACALQPAICHAVDMTYQAVLTFHGEPFPALSHGNSAGKTVDFTTIFRKMVQSPSGVVAPLAAKDRLLHHWRYVISKEELAGKLGLNNITDVQPYVKCDKVYGLKIIGDGLEKDVDFITFQQALGKGELLSNDFTVEFAGHDIVFDGFGEGVGVGLCMYSAKVLAEKGQKASQILQTFFPDTKIEKIPSW